MEETKSPDSGGIDVWVGLKDKKEVCGIIIFVDCVKQDSEPNALIAYAEEEMQIVLSDINRKVGMRKVLFRH